MDEEQPTLTGMAAQSSPPAAPPDLPASPGGIVQPPSPTTDFTVPSTSPESPPAPADPFSTTMSLPPDPTQPPQSPVYGLSSEADPAPTTPDPAGPDELPQDAAPDPASPSTTQDCSQPLDPPEEFVWEEYLEETATQAVPPTAFHHVEGSLESGVLCGQLVEVVHHPGGQAGPASYWPACVLTTCGPLLRLGYITPPGVTSLEVWQEVGQGRLHPAGWGAQHSLPLTPPPDLGEALAGGEEAAAREEAERRLREGESVPEEALEAQGYTALDRIKPGMKVEILHEGDPLSGWVGTVGDNVGGRLLLSYDTPDAAAPTFWLFYCHPRLRPMDWINSQAPHYQYSPPTWLGQYGKAEWAALLELSQQDGRRYPLPPALLLPLLSPPAHSLTPGTLLEVVVSPFVEVQPARVTSVPHPSHVELTLLSHGEGDSQAAWVTSLLDPLLLPCGFALSQGLPMAAPADWPGTQHFDWAQYSSHGHLAGPQSFPQRTLAQELGFEAALRLEAVDPAAGSRVCVATVARTCLHLLLVQLDSEVDRQPLIVAADSCDLLPTGWSQANGCTLHLPPHYHPRPVLEPLSPTVKEEGGGEGPGQPSMWCPRLYVNHWCYTGPYLSKTKVAKAPRSVGPGPVELVLREVLAATITAAYIPTRVLRELQRRLPSNLPLSWTPTPFKARFKRYSYAAQLPVATTAGDVSDFLAWLCSGVQCCPNLWSSQSTGDRCPLHCTSQMSLPGSQGVGRGRPWHGGRPGLRGQPGSTRVIHRRKRGGRKRLFVPIRPRSLLQPAVKTLSGPGEEVVEEGEEEEEGEILLEDGEDLLMEDGAGSGSEGGGESSRPCSPDSQSAARHHHSLAKVRGGRRGGGGRGRGEEPGWWGPSVLEPATVTSDPLEWSMEEVEEYVGRQPGVSHLAARLRQQEVDGRALLLLNLPSLLHHLQLPHTTAAALAQHVCRVKLAHFLYYRPHDP